MTTTHSLSHTKWDCKYHIVWIPEYRKKKLFWELRQELRPVLRELATHRESEILEGRLRPGHVHILILIPPKYAVSQVVGYIKGKSAIHIARNYLGRSRNFKGNTSGPEATISQTFAARGLKTGLPKRTEGDIIEWILCRG